MQSKPFINGLKRVVLLWCCAVSAMMVLFPPLQYRGGQGDGYGFLFQMQPYHQVNLTTLLLQIMLIWFVGGVVTFVNQSTPSQSTNFDIGCTKKPLKFFTFINAYWSGNRPLTTGFYFIAIFGVTALFIYFFSHVEVISDALHIRTALAKLVFVLWITYVILAWVIIWRCSRSKRTLDRIMTRICMFLYFAIFTLTVIMHNKTYLEKTSRPISLDDLKFDY